MSKNDLIHTVTDVAATSPKSTAIVSSLAVGSGASAYFDLVSDGIGIAASATGLLLAMLMIRKVRAETLRIVAEREKLQLEILELRRKSGSE